MASNIALLPNLTAEGNLARYLNEIQRFPMLQATKNTCWLEDGWSTKIRAAHQL